MVSLLDCLKEEMKELLSFAQSDRECEVLRYPLVYRVSHQQQLEEFMDGKECLNIQLLWRRVYTKLNNCEKALKIFVIPKNVLYYDDWELSLRRLISVITVVASSGGCRIS